MARFIVRITLSTSHDLNNAFCNCSCNFKESLYHVQPRPVSTPCMFIGSWLVHQKKAPCSVLEVLQLEDWGSSNPSVSSSFQPLVDDIMNICVLYSLLLLNASDSFTIAAADMHQQANIIHTPSRHGVLAGIWQMWFRVVWIQISRPQSVSAHLLIPVPAFYALHI